MESRKVSKIRSLSKPIKKGIIFLSIFFLFLNNSIIFLSPQGIQVEAASKTLTSRVDFERGSFSNSEAKSKEGELKLKADGSWGARAWKTPNIALSDQSAIVSDGEYIYLLNSTDNHFSRYIPEENKWQTLRSAPHYAYQGADLVVLGNYIYAIFGGYQKEFSRYSIATNTWDEKAQLPDLIVNGASISTDGTYIYVLRGTSTTEFWRYSISTNTWTAITGPPATISAGANLVFDSGYLYTPRGAGTVTFYRYDISAGTWSTMANAPGTIGEDHNIDKKGDYIYVTRDGGTADFYKYRISTNTWSTITSTPYVTRYVGVVYNEADDQLYVFRGNGTADFWKYDTDSEAFLGPNDFPTTPGSGADLVHYSGSLYAPRGNNTQTFYRYNTSTNAWTTLANTPATFNDDTKGVAAGTYLYFLRGSSTTAFYRYQPSNDTWTTMAVTPATISYGASLVYPGSGDYIYATRGVLTRSFYRYTISTDTWDDVSVADLPDDAEAAYGSRMIYDGSNIYYIAGLTIAQVLRYNIGANTWTVVSSMPFTPFWGTDITYYGGKIYAQAGYYKNDFWEYSISDASWRRLADMGSTFAQDVGPYNGGSLESDGTGNLYSIKGQNILHMQTYTVSSNDYVATGTWTSDIQDLSYVSSWASLSTSVTTPGDSSITFQTRSSTDATTWSGWESVSSGVIASAVRRFLQIRVTFNSTTDRSATPLLSGLTINYTGDEVAPSSPSGFTGRSQAVGGVSLTSGNSYSYAYPYFAWTAAAENETSIDGYYVYFGTNQTADPETLGNYQTGTNYTVTSLLSNGTYYLRVKAKDLSGNMSTAITGFIYTYSGVSTNHTVTGTSTDDFIGGTATNVSVTSDKIKLATKTGFWEQERFTAAPTGMLYGSNFAYVSSTGKLYMLRGTNSANFYEYNLNTDTWTALANSPATAYTGTDIAEGPPGYLFAFRGINTTTFWRYDIANNVWSDEAAADPSLSVFYGGSIVYDGSRYMYALRGNSDDAFVRYDTQENQWESLANTDFGSPSRQINNLVYVGGEIAYDNSDTIYAIQGNTRSGFSSYSISSNTWTVLPNLPALAYDGAQIEYDSTTDSIYYLPGWTKPFFFRYDISTESWVTLPDAPAPIAAGATMRNVNGVLHIMRGANTSTFYKYNIAKNSWMVPTVGLFGRYFRGSEYDTFNYGADITKGAGNTFYLTKGNYDNMFISYNSATGETVRLADAPVGFFQGGDLEYDAVNNKVYAVASVYIRKFYVYDVPTDTWSEIATDPMPVDAAYGGSLEFDGERYFYWLRGGNTTTFYRYDTQATAGSRWSAMATTPATMQYGAELIYKDGYIYTPRGANTLSFYRYTVSGNTWSDAAVADLPSGGTVYNDGFTVDGGDGKLYTCRGGNQVGCYSYTIATDTWAALPNAPANIYVGGAAASNGADRILVIPGGSGTNTFTNGLYTYIMQTDNSSFQEEGSFISATHDLTATYRFSNISLTYTAVANSSLTVETRTSADNSTWSSWSEGSESKAVGTAVTYKINSPANRYIQVKLTLTSSDGIYSSEIADYNISYYQDTTAPTSPSSLLAYNGASESAALTTNTWYNHTAPQFNWPDADEVGGATDTSTGSGVTGYYVYFGTSASGDPEDDGTLTTSSVYTAASLVSGSTYYLRIKTVDDAGNISTTWDAFTYKYDTTLPSNPTTLVVSPSGYTATNSFGFNWSGAADTASLVSEYCYKTGAAGATETCTSDASINAITAYRTGANTFFIRTKDTAGNYSSDYATASYYYSSTAPSAPQNLEVDPTSSTKNEFGFTWEPPELYYGNQSGLRYYYSINAVPTSSNVNDVGLVNSYLTASSYATQKGENTFYVVAKDEAGNIDYNVYASVDFTAETTAPGIPTDLDIADVSIKETKAWKLAVTWESPVASGSGVAVYKVYKSAATAPTCTDNFDDFTYVSSTTTTSFIDSGLAQKKYHYCVKSCDSTNECSAASSTVAAIPDGKWRVAPELVASPSATVKTRAATISWSTNRTASSFVKYGKSSGDFGEEVGSSDPVTSHEIDITGLDPGTTYYYKVLWTDEDGNTGTSDEMTLTTNDAPFVSSVKITNISLYNAYVTFKVKNAVKASVEYGKTIAYGAVESLSTAKSESTYTVNLTSLTEGTVFRLRVTAEDEEGNKYSGDDYVFQTLPVPKVLGLKVQQVEGMPTATLRLLWGSNTKLTSIVTYYPTARPELAKDIINLTPKQNHEAILKDLIDETEYTILVKGKDAAGNEAVSPSKTVQTASDLRPPEVLNTNVETTIVGVGEEARAQIIISWDTDEPSTSQVEYGEGTGMTYGASTQEDVTLTSNHVVTIPGLAPSKIYHVRIISKDKNKNAGNSSDIVIITPNATKDALNLVVNKLSKTFGFLKSSSFFK